ncbi:MAG TPA: hypothetical protein VFK11_04315 [Candidatus Saccharimonadales bacterium]|nr:hypothetical protein [Candidatus Saccharimonadales bacterium]
MHESPAGYHVYMSEQIDDRTEEEKAKSRSVGKDQLPPDHVMKDQEDDRESLREKGEEKKIKNRPEE